MCLSVAATGASLPTNTVRVAAMCRDGCIGWNEFEAFMMDEFAAGKHLLSGEYVLPSGGWIRALILEGYVSKVWPGCGLALHPWYMLSGQQQQQQQHSDRSSSASSAAAAAGIAWSAQ